MKQEDKELLLKDLSARLPYGVKFLRESWNYEWDQNLSVIEVLEDIDKDGYINNTKVYNIEDIKPYLFPLSNMTEEQKQELKGLIMQNAFSNNTTFTQQDFFCKYHLDYRGLIQLGLALDATNLNIY